MGKIAENKQHKLDKLLSSAFQLFLQNGIEKTSVSDITHAAGVAKGTFYLYFHDKYEVRDRLIARNASKLFLRASAAMELEELPAFEDKIIFLVNHILTQLSHDKALLMFISKNLSWGVFRHALTEAPGDTEIDFLSVYYTWIANNPAIHFKDPEIMLFMIIELASSVSYSTILYDDPIRFEDVKPYLYHCIRDIIQSHRTDQE
ncbi:MAG TPA: TetR family transcriptional regulator [Lachnospiraceae bacterium]|nr:TetR family transcriptional regulator [Lachnospiraceae bacterium]